MIKQGQIKKWILVVQWDLKGVFMSLGNGEQVRGEMDKSRPKGSKLALRDS